MIHWHGLDLGFVNYKKVLELHDIGYHQQFQIVSTIFYQPWFRNNCLQLRFLAVPL
jgi:hypothetical protein